MLRHDLVRCICVVYAWSDRVTIFFLVDRPVAVRWTIVWLFCLSVSLCKCVVREPVVPHSWFRANGETLNRSSHSPSGWLLRKLIRSQEKISCNIMIFELKTWAWCLPHVNVSGVGGWTCDAVFFLLLSCCRRNRENGVESRGTKL